MMMFDLKILCFIPMRNCQSKIGPLLSKFQEQLLHNLTEILVVDNASTDGSLDEARRALSQIRGPKVTLFQNGQNYGLGGSHKIAFNYAKENQYDYLFVVHGDDSADPNAFLPIFERSLSNFEMVLSDRLSGGYPRAGYPLHRLLFNRILSMIASLLTFKKVNDFGGGPLNLYRVSSFLNTFENSLKGFSSEIEFAQHALLYGIFRRMNISFVPIDFVEREEKPTPKLVSQFLKPILFLLKYRLHPRKTIARDLRGSYFGHNYLKVKVDPEAPVMPPSPKPRAMKKDELLDLGKVSPQESFSSYELMGSSDKEVVWVRMCLLPWHLQSNVLESQINRFLESVPPERIILDISGDEVVKSKQCYDFLTFCLDRGIEPQLITDAVGDINLWRNYAKLVKNLTLNYIPGTVQRSFFFELCREVAPMGNVSINVLTHPKYFYHSVGLKKKIESEVSCTSLLLQPYALEENESLPEDHLHILLEQTAVVHTWLRNDVFRKHGVYTFGQALKDKARYERSLKMGFMDLSTRKISKQKIGSYELVDDAGSSQLLTSKS